MTWPRLLAAAIVVCAAQARAGDLRARPVPDAALAAEMVAGHNAVRAQVGAPPLLWDDALARQAMVVAQANLAQEQLEHSDAGERSGQGENLAAVFGGHDGARSLLALWTAEKARYPGGAIDCDGDETAFDAYGHYTQMIWRGTTRVGCAIASGAAGQVLACRYWPPGNICGFRPEDPTSDLALSR